MKTHVRVSPLSAKDEAELARPRVLGNTERQSGETMNALRVIHPYKYEDMWVFDDARAGLVQEPFVSGADTIIDRMVSGIPNAERGFSLIFSAEPFPGYQARLEWRREEHRGNWYFSPELAMEGWLCPALFKYFDAAPREIYAQFKARAA